MRQIATAISLGILVALAGCSSTKFSWMKNNDRPPGPSNSKDLPTADQLVKYMNDNAKRIQNLRVDDLGITASMGIQSFDLRGIMATERGDLEKEAPKKNFRMIAKVLGSPSVDIGSNDQEFWFWISKGDPYQFFCSYKDLSEGRIRKMPIPFQPEMVMESLGLGPYGPADKYNLEHDSKTIRLVEKTTMPDGRAVRKVIVFNKDEVSVPTPQITDYLLLDDATGKEICGAHVRDVQRDPATNAFLPKRIELRCPSEKMQLALRLDGLTVNPGVSPQVFTRTLSTIPSFNLARGQVDNSAPPQAYADSRIRPAQGLAP